MVVCEHPYGVGDDKRSALLLNRDNVRILEDQLDSTIKRAGKFFCWKRNERILEYLPPSQSPPGCYGSKCDVPSGRAFLCCTMSSDPRPKDCSFDKYIWFLACISNSFTQMHTLNKSVELIGACVNCRMEDYLIAQTHHTIEDGCNKTWSRWPYLPPTRCSSLGMSWKTLRRRGVSRRRTCSSVPEMSPSSATSIGAFGVDILACPRGQPFAYIFLDMMNSLFNRCYQSNACGGGGAVGTASADTMCVHLHITLSRPVQTGARWQRAGCFS